MLKSCIKMFVVVMLFCHRETSCFVVSPSWSSPSTKAVRRFSSLISARPGSIVLGSIKLGLSNSVEQNNVSGKRLSIRDRLRRITGFSFTAFRATLRGITGISLTAIYDATVVTTSSVVRETMKVIVGVFPAWFRYFLQPFLVMYYVPLFMIRGNLSPAVKERRAAHEHLVESWSEAVEAAEQAQEGGYWPVHVTEEGNIVAVVPPVQDADPSQVDVAEAVAESVELIMEKKQVDENG